jgi:hypothetical protein
MFHVHVFSSSLRGERSDINGFYARLYGIKGCSSPMGFSSKNALCGVWRVALSSNLYVTASNDDKRVKRYLMQLEIVAKTMSPLQSLIAFGGKGIVASSQQNKMLEAAAFGLVTMTFDSKGRAGPAKGCGNKEAELAVPRISRRFSRVSFEDYVRIVGLGAYSNVDNKARPRMGTRAHGKCYGFRVGKVFSRMLDG